jgi:predicted DNA binding CopG/RHH family protein
MSDNKYYELDSEEQHLEDSINIESLKPLKNSATLKARIVEAARNTNAKTHTINIRLPERDLYRLKAKALQEGMPYQTLIASILHKSI